MDANSGFSSSARSAGMVRPPRAVIVGGSIAGCAMAVELQRIGWQVCVLERSAQPWTDRGAAISLPSVVFDALLQRGLVDPGTPHLRSTHCARLVRDDAQRRFGRRIWDQPAEVVHLRWQSLFEQLQRRVSPRAYRRGASVVASRCRGEIVEVQLADGEALECELLIHADGYQSQGRRALFPDCEVKFAGYVLWRGMLPDSSVEAELARALRFCTVGYPEGHGVFYPVPGVDGSIEVGSRSLYFALYIRVDECGLPDLLADRGQHHHGSLPLHALPDAPARALAARVGAGLPEAYAWLIRGVERSFLHAVFDGPVRGYRVGRVLLAGDAGALAAPTSGTGVLKAVHDAARLAQRLAQSPDAIESALAAWNDERTEHGNRATEYGRQLAHVLVHEVPDWPTVDATALWRRFARTVTHWDAVRPLQEHA